MCGRLACGLDPDQICNSCSYKKTDNSFSKPKWIDFFNYDKTYKTSYNICPTELAPVLVSGRQFDINSRIVAPMIFGLIPPWKKGCEDSKYCTINCRIETVKTSKLYSLPLLKGQRCVVICSGFYEWHKNTSNTKKPYFIHAKQPSGVFVDIPSTWNLESALKDNISFKPLRLAALFDKKNCDMEGGISCSFTVITKSSNEMSWLHPRMPVLIETEEQLDVWLDSEKFDENAALHYLSLSQRDNFTFYSVSNVVNKGQNKDISCIKQDRSSKETERNSQALLRNWLNKSTKREDDRHENNYKKLKRNN